TLSRLTRSSILALALEWLDSANVQLCEPYLLDEEHGDGDGYIDAPYDPTQSIEELREVYQEYQARKGTKREIIDRIIEGDWRHGLTLYQLAMAETRYLIDHPTSQRWNALKLIKKGSEEDTTDEDLQVDKHDYLPRFHAQTFLLNLQREISSITKAHHYLTRPQSLPVTLLRIFLHHSPYNTQRSVIDATMPKQGLSEGMRSIFIVFPDGSPFVYVSLPTATIQAPGVEGRSLQRIVIE
ncbi:hypothetical protein LTS18_014728, partial [Coniosporium uncinatum]